MATSTLFDNQTSQWVFTATVMAATTIAAYIINKRHFAPIPGTSGPQPEFLIGNFRNILMKYKGLWSIWKNVQHYGPLVVVWVGPKRIILVNDPNITDEIMKNKEFYDSDPSVLEMFSHLIPGSMFSTKGDTWKRHRKALIPILATERLRYLTTKMDHTVSVSIKNIKDRIRETDEPIKVENDLQDMALDTMGYLAFGHAFRDIDGKDSSDLPQIEVPLLKKSFDAIRHEILPRSMGIRLYKYFGDSKRVRDAKNELTKIVHILLNEYEVNRQKKDGNRLEQTEWENFMNRSFIAQVLDSNDGHDFTFDELRGEMITMILGGTNTTAGTISYAIKLLSEYPNVQEKLYEEIIAVIGKDAVPQYEQLQECSMPYLNNVVKEIQRLSLLVPSTSRYSTKETTIGNVVFPKGTQFWLSIAQMHRDPKYWKDPLVFLPERWNADGIANGGPINPKAFHPFGGGSRICFGMKLAAFELRFMIVCMTRAFFFKELPPHLKDKMGEEQVEERATTALANIVALPVSRP